MQGYSPWSRLYPGSLHTVATEERPSGATEIVGTHAIQTWEKVAVAGSLAALAWTALAPERLVPWARSGDDQPRENAPRRRRRRR